MKSIIRFDSRTLYNPTRKIISSTLHKTRAYYELSLYLMKTRIQPTILNHLYSRGYYQTSSGGKLTLYKNMVYLTLGGMICSLKDLTILEKRMDSSKQEVLIHFPIYPERIKDIDMFNRMLGKAWKKN